MMNDALKSAAGSKEDSGPFSFALIVILVGVMLILASLLPVGDFTKDVLWTDEDAAAFSHISQEYHRKSYQTPQRAGLTEEQLKAQLEKMKIQYEVMRAKLQNAQQQPTTWKRYLLWTGVLLVVSGFLGHKSSDQR